MVDFRCVHRRLLAKYELFKTIGNGSNTYSLQFRALTGLAVVKVFVVLKNAKANEEIVLSGFLLSWRWFWEVFWCQQGMPNSLENEVQGIP